MLGHVAGAMFVHMTFPVLEAFGQCSLGDAWRHAVCSVTKRLVLGCTESFLWCPRLMNPCSQEHC